MRRPNAVKFTKHALERVALWQQHGFALDEDTIRQILLQPEKVQLGYRGRKVVQGLIDEEHVLRVVFEEKEEELLVVTVYPARRNRYG